MVGVGVVEGSTKVVDGGIEVGMVEVGVVISDDELGVLSVTVTVVEKEVVKLVDVTPMVVVITESVTLVPGSIVSARMGIIDRVYLSTLCLSSGAKGLRGRRGLP